MKLTTRGLILAVAAVAAIAAASCGGSTPSQAVQTEESIDAFDAELAEVIPDENRRQAIHGAIADLHAVVRVATEQRRTFARRILTLHKDYDAPRADFEAAIQGHLAERAVFRQGLYAFRQRLLDNTTNEEWEGLRGLRNDALESLMRTTAQGPEATATDTEENATEAGEN
ncbi:MAG: hypothetical protein DRJ42_23175 [Deltaproteobacteria bacterium]|nr:MAG: hypothetical protein DRJ42_23175 [Deltaproteobacteria bacterium]